MRTRALWLVASLGFMACPDRHVETAVPDAGIEAVDAGVTIEDAGPPVPTNLQPTVIATAPDGGTTAVTANLELADAPNRLTVTLPVKLKDFRVRLIDWRDQVVVSDDELDAAGTTLTVALPEPLKTGRGYTLVLDGELAPIVTDELGRPFNDWELTFRIAGDVQPEPGAPKKAPKKKKK